MIDPKAKALDKLMGELQKQFGEDAVLWGHQVKIGDPISTGSLALDFATGYGGLPANRIVEICGRPGTGKTTLALLTMLNALKKYPKRGALFLDVEHKITPEWLEQIVGKDVIRNRMIYVQPTSIEQATNVYRAAVSGGDICCAILDSVGGAATVRRNDDAEVGHYGGNAIGVGEFSRVATSIGCGPASCLTIGINQTRVDMTGRFVLNTPGGDAWKHACVLRIELVRGKEVETIKIPGEEKPFPVAFTVMAKIRKNQVGIEGRVAKYWFYNQPTENKAFGVDKLDEITRLGLVTGVIERRGGYYHHPSFPDLKGEHRVLGQEAMHKLITDDEKIADRIVKEVLASLADHANEVAPLIPDEPAPEGPQYQNIVDLAHSNE